MLAHQYLIHRAHPKQLFITGACIYTCIHIIFTSTTTTTTSIAIIFIIYITIRNKHRLSMIVKHNKHNSSRYYRNQCILYQLCIVDRYWLFIIIIIIIGYFGIFCIFVGYVYYGLYTS